MFEVAAQIVICLIVAALIGGVIGYLIGRAGCTEKSSCTEGKEGTHELHIDQKESTDEVSALMSSDASAEQEDVEEKPTLLSAPREGGKDNLQLIKGVGKVLEGVLNEIGIYHFDQIANLTKEEIKWLDNSIAFPGRIEREEWVAQARDLAAGIQTEFAARVERGEVSSSKKSSD